MKIIYYCYGGTHSSVLAAAIHTGKLSNNKIPSKEEIYALPLYDKVTGAELGSPFYYGKDELSNEIYVLGLGTKRLLIKEFLLDYLKLFDINTEEVMLIAALPYVNFFTKLGGVLSRRLGLIFLGRPLVTYTLQRLYPDYTELVEHVKKRLKNMAST